jgi:hypothetical protein
MEADTGMIMRDSTKVSDAQAHALNGNAASVLVVATRSAASDELLDALRARAARGLVAFDLVVPATPSGWAWLADMFSAADEAYMHLQAAMARFAEARLPVRRAEVGDPDCLSAVMDAVNFESYHEIIICTKGARSSRRLGTSLASRVRRLTELPVLDVAGSIVRTQPMPAHAATPATSPGRMRRLPATSSRSDGSQRGVAGDRAERSRATSTN